MTLSAITQTLKISPQDQKIIKDCVSYYQSGGYIQTAINFFATPFGSSYYQGAERTLSRYFFRYFLDDHTTASISSCQFKAEKCSSFVLNFLIEIHSCNKALPLEIEIKEADFLFAADLIINPSICLKKLFMKEYSELSKCFSSLVVSPQNLKYIESELPSKLTNFLKKNRTHTSQDMEEIIQLRRELVTYKNKATWQPKKLF